jgi:hypothetical protein
MIAIGRPTPTEHAPFFAGYIALVPETDVMSALEAQSSALQALARAVPVDKETFAYAPGKWTVREVLGHVTDAERVFGHRAFCISRGEPATLPAFDENAYVARSVAASVPLAALADEFALVRAANLVFLRRLDGEGWARLGTVSSGPASVRALAFIMAGHVRHHLGVLAERYAVRAA